MLKFEGLHVLVSLDSVQQYSFVELIRFIIEGGASVIQLRDKCANDEALIHYGKILLNLIDGKIPLIIDDRVDVAMKIGAGVHVGQKDMSAKETRAIIGPSKIL